MHISYMHYEGRAKIIVLKEINRKMFPVKVIMRNNRFKSYLKKLYLKITCLTCQK